MLVAQVPRGVALGTMLLALLRIHLSYLSKYKVQVTLITTQLYAQRGLTVREGMRRMFLYIGRQALKSYSKIDPGLSLVHRLLVPSSRQGAALANR